jgi:hypothetical protein
MSNSQKVVVNDFQYFTTENCYNMISLLRQLGSYIQESTTIHTIEKDIILKVNKIKYKLKTVEILFVEFKEKKLDKRIMIIDKAIEDNLPFNKTFFNFSVNENEFRNLLDCKFIKTASQKLKNSCIYRLLPTEEPAKRWIMLDNYETTDIFFTKKKNGHNIVIKLNDECENHVPILGECFFRWGEQQPSYKKHKKYKEELNITEKQLEIILAIFQSKDSVIAINAYAGCGKTYLAKYISYRNRTLYLSFTNKVVAEFDGKGLKMTCDKFIRVNFGLYGEPWFELKEEFNRKDNFFIIKSMDNPFPGTPVFLKPREYNEEYDFIIIDEFTTLGCNMIYLLIQIIQYKYPMARVILMGDILQNGAIDVVQNSSIKSLLLATQIFTLSENMRAVDEKLKYLINLLTQNSGHSLLRLLKKNIVNSIDWEDLYSKNFTIIVSNNRYLDFFMLFLFKCFFEIYKITGDESFQPTYFKNRFKEEVEIYNKILLIKNMYYLGLVYPYKGKTLQYVGCQSTDHNLILYMKEENGKVIQLEETEFYFPKKIIGCKCIGFPILPKYISTAYIIQGETIGDRTIYVYPTDMTISHIYVAISRAKRLEQIKVLCPK